MWKFSQPLALLILGEWRDYKIEVFHGSECIGIKIRIDGYKPVLICFGHRFGKVYELCIPGGEILDIID